MLWLLLACDAATPATTPWAGDAPAELAADEADAVPAAAAGTEAAPEAAPEGAPEAAPEAAPEGAEPALAETPTQPANPPTAPSSPEPTKAELDEMISKSAILKMLSTRGDSSGTAGDLWAESDRTAIDEALRGSSGVAVAESSGHLAQTDGGSVARGRADAGEGPAAPRHAVKLLSSGAPDDVERVLKKHLGRIQFCVEQEDPASGGRIDVAFDVQGGVPGQVTLAANTTDDAELGACFQASVRRMRFTPESSGVSL